MKRIKTFRLFESGFDNQFSYDDCMDLVDDIKSLEYIIDEDADYYKVSYNIVFRVDPEFLRVVPHGGDTIVLSSNSAKTWIDNCNRVGFKFNYVGIRIEISYDLNKLLAPSDTDWVDLSVKKVKDLSLDKLNDLCQRYSNLLRDHLDYVGSPVKSVEFWRNPSEGIRRCLIEIELL